MYVYIIQCAQYYKIGIAENVKDRFSAIKSATPFEMKIINSFESDYPEKDEQKLHEKFKKKHKQGEWFELNKEDIEFIEGWFKTKELHKQRQKEKGIIHHIHQRNIGGKSYYDYHEEGDYDSHAKVKENY